MPCFGYGEVLILGCFSPYVLISPHVQSFNSQLLDSQKHHFLDGQGSIFEWSDAAWNHERSCLRRCTWESWPMVAGAGSRHSALGELTVQSKSRHFWYLCHLMSIRCVFNEITWNCLYSRWKKESVNSSICLIWTSFFRPTRCQFLWRFRKALMFSFRTRDT